MPERLLERLSVNVKDGVQDYLGEVEVDHEAGTQMLEEAWAEIDSNPSLEINMVTKLPYRRFLGKPLGLYCPSEGNIYLSAPTIRKHSRDLEETEENAIIHCYMKLATLLTIASVASIE